MTEKDNLKLVAVRISEEQFERLGDIVRLTGWSQSEVIRRLIDNAMVRPAQVASEIGINPKGDARL